MAKEHRLMMRAERRPRIALADLIILVAAVALGMAVTRTTVESSIGGWYLRHVPSPHSHWVGPLGGGLPVYSFLVLVNGVPQILVASLCVVVLSVRSRGASAPRLSHRPGFVLCLAAVAASGWATAMHWTIFRVKQWDFRVEFCRFIINHILPNSGLMVLGLWIGLALGGRAAPVPSRLDRIGYALGASLVLLLALDTLRMVLEWVRVM